MSETFRDTPFCENVNHGGDAFPPPTIRKPTVNTTDVVVEVVVDLEAEVVSVVRVDVPDDVLVVVVFPGSGGFPPLAYVPSIVVCNE